MSEKRIHRGTFELKREEVTGSCIMGFKMCTFHQLVGRPSYRYLIGRVGSMVMGDEKCIQDFA